MIESTQKPHRQSSPRFPFISLQKALERAEQLRVAGGGGPVLVNSARQTWGYRPKSSGGHQTIAALKAYGLAEEMSSGDQRQIVLLQDTIRYFRDERPGERTALLKKFVLQPRAMSQAWSDWNGPPPDGHIARSHLKIVRSFSDRAADEFLEIYRANISFADLVTSDIISRHGDDENGDWGNDQNGRAEHQPESKRRQQMRPGMNEDTFTMKEGTVVLQWPDRLSQESYEDLEAWAQLVLRKVKRHISEGGTE